MSKENNAPSKELVKCKVCPKFTTSREEWGKGQIVWSGPEPVPQIGDTVRLRINSIGLGRVESYAVYEGYLGLMVSPFDPPQWWKNQSNEHKPPYSAALAFGAEIALVKEV